MKPHNSSYVPSHDDERLSNTGLIHVSKGSSEYEAVLDKFCTVEYMNAEGKRVVGRSAILAKSLLSVFRVQNQGLYERYVNMRNQFITSLGHQRKIATEQVLWHGPGTVKALEGITMR